MCQSVQGFCWNVVDIVFYVVGDFKGKCFYQQWDIVGMFMQWWQMDWEYVELVVEIVMEFFVDNYLFEIVVGGGD